MYSAYMWEKQYKVLSDTYTDERKERLKAARDGTVFHF